MPSAANLLKEKRGLEKAVEPSLAKEGRGDFLKTSFERRPVQSDTAMRSKNNFFQKLIGVTTCKIVVTLYW